MSYNTGSWSSLYCSAQQATGLRPQMAREQLLPETGSRAGSCFNHQTRTVASLQEKNNCILHATRCISLGEEGFLHMLPSYFQINVLLRGEVSSLHSRKSLQSKTVKLGSPKPGYEQTYMIICNGPLDSMRDSLYYFRSPLDSGQQNSSHIWAHLYHIKKKKKKKYYLWGRKTTVSASSKQGPPAPHQMRI